MKLTVTTRTLTLISAIGLILFSINTWAALPKPMVPPEKRAYNCSLKINQLSNGKVLVDLRDVETNFDQVAKDQNDWQAYKEVFEGLGHTIQKEISRPLFFTARLVPNSESGSQNVAMELSFQHFNKFKESKMEPTAEARGSADQKVEVTQFDRGSGMKLNFSCEARL